MQLNYLFFFFFLFIGYGIGSFATAQIIYPIFVALPMLFEWKRQGRIEKVPYVFTLITPLLWLGIVWAVYLLISTFTSYPVTFLIGLGVSTLMVLGQIRNPNNVQDTKESYARYLKK